MKDEKKFNVIRETGFNANMKSWMETSSYQWPSYPFLSSTQWLLSSGNVAIIFKSILIEFLIIIYMTKFYVALETFPIALLNTLNYAPHFIICILCSLQHMINYFAMKIWYLMSSLLKCCKEIFRWRHNLHSYKCDVNKSRMNESRRKPFGRWFKFVFKLM